MEKALRMGKVSAIGSFQLFIGKAASTVIMAVGTIILARLMLPAEYGLYSIALISPLMIGLFQDWGVSLAMTKYIANFRATNKDEDIYDIIVAGLTFKIIMGLVLSFLSFFLASFVATAIFNRPESAALISVASITIVSGSLLTASQSNFNGFERMGLNSLTMIFQSIIKTVASPLLVLLGYGALGAVIGYTLSFLVAGILGLIMLYFLLLRNLRRINTHRSNIYRTLKLMLRFGVPLSISTILAGFLIQFYGFMMAFFCSDVMIGNYQVAVNFSILLTFFTFPIATVLFPAFAKLNPKSESQLLQTIFTSAVKYTALLLIPATMAVAVLSKPMISTLFGEKWIYAPFFLTLYVIGNLFVMVGGQILGTLLAGLGETKILMKLSLLTLSFGIPLAFLLIPSFGITGVILGALLSGIPSLIVGLYWVWKHYKVKADYYSSVKIFASSTIAASAIFMSTNLLHTAEWIRLTVGLVLFLTIYIFTAPLLGAVTESDIVNLRAMIPNLGIISRLINKFLTLTEKVAIWRARTKTKVNSQ